MERNGKGINSGIRAIITVVALLLCCTYSKAQAPSSEETGVEITRKKSGTEKLKDFTLKTINFVDWLLNTVDTTYVEKCKYNMTLMPEYSYGYEHYRFASSAGERQSISIAPNGYSTIGLNIGWRWLIVGYSINLQENHPSTDFNASLCSTRFVLDLYYRKNSEGYRIKRLSGFNDGGKELKGYESKFNGLTVEQAGAGVYYAFNNKFSYAAAYGMSTVQRRSAGSFVLGMGYNQQRFLFDHSSLAPQIAMGLKDGLNFKELRYNDFNISFGYSYNWAFAKDFLAGITLSPSIGYKKGVMLFPHSSSIEASLNFDIVTRAALIYSNGKYYAGATLDSHAFFYNRNGFSAINGFGVLEVCAGFNFWRKK